MKQIKDMTTAEWRKAWTEIAVAFETEPKKRTNHQQYIVIDGLCVGWRRHVINYESIGKALSSIHEGDKCGYWFPPQCLGGTWTHQHDLLRSTFAAMFAAMTPKEFLEICEAPR